jgi:hypothetical protein
MPVRRYMLRPGPGTALLQPVPVFSRSSLSDDNGVDRRFTSFHLLFKPLLFTSHSTSRR